MVAAVPALNFAKLPEPLRVHYPTPKNAAPQAHPGGAHLVHRSWPMPPAPPPKVAPKNPQDLRMWADINQKQKAVVPNGGTYNGTGGPSWWGFAKHNSMQPARHLKREGHLVEPIGSDFVHARLPPRPVVFWGNKKQEGREAARQAAVLGVDEGKVRTVGPRIKKERWMPSKDETAQYFHVSKSTYIRGSAALVKQQFLNDRAKAAQGRPSSSTGERPNGRRSASPARTRPSSACSMRSSGKQSAWWTKNSWDSSQCEDTIFSKTKINTYKRRLLEDIMQEATHVRVDDSDAHKFGAGTDNYKWTEVEVIRAKPKSTGKAKRLVVKKKRPRVGEKPSGGAVRPGSAPPGKRRAQPCQSNRAVQLITEQPNVDVYDSADKVAAHYTHMRPSDRRLHPSRAQMLHASSVRAVMERSSSTLRHIEALKKRQLTDEEIREMKRNYYPHVSPAKFSRQEYESSLSVDLELESPCSLNSGIDEDEDEDEDTQDTFEFTEGEEETLGHHDRSSDFYGNEIEQDSFRSHTSDEYLEHMELGEGGGGEPDKITPKDATAFMPSRAPGIAATRSSFDDPSFFQGNHLGNDLNRTNSSISSAESNHRRGTEEDSRVPYGPPSGATDPAAAQDHYRNRDDWKQMDQSSTASLGPASLSEDDFHGVVSADASSRVAFISLGGQRAENRAVHHGQEATRQSASTGAVSGKWPAAAAGLFSAVSNSSNLL